MNKIKLLIPKRNELKEESIEFLTNKGWVFNNIGHLFGEITQPKGECYFLRSRDIVKNLLNNQCDLGFVGEDILMNESAIDKIVPLERTNIHDAKIAFLIPKDMNKQDFSLDKKRIATVYTNIVKDYINKHNIDAEVIDFQGSAECAIKMGVADCVVDNIYTGKTIAEAQLQEFLEIAKTSLLLVTSKEKYSEVKSLF